MTSREITRPDLEVPTPDLAAVEATVRNAIDRGRRDSVSIVGSGEFTLALRCPVPGGECVVKRVPPFSSMEQAERYIAVVDRYIARLEHSGVRCVRTRQHVLARGDGTVVVYETQPLLDAIGLADHLLRDTEPTADHPIIPAVVDRIVVAVRDGIPIDGQVANWYWFEDEPWQLDFSAPFDLDERGNIPFEVLAFLRQFPKVARGYVHREFRRLAPKYLEVDYVVTDLMTQLNRQQLHDWSPTVAAYARAAHGIDVSPAKAKELAAEDAKFYPMIHRMKCAQRWWIQHTGRRFDFLLPETSSYGR